MPVTDIPSPLVLQSHTGAPSLMGVPRPPNGKRAAPCFPVTGHVTGCSARGIAHRLTGILPLYERGVLWVD